MDIQAEKIELVKRLLDTEDEAVIREVKSVFESHEKDFWNELPDHGKAGIERSRKQAETSAWWSDEKVC